MQEEERRRISLLLIAAFVVATIAFVIITPGFSILERFTGLGKAAPTTTDGANYVGSLRCKECHEGTYAGWKTTLHPHMVQELGENVVLGDFMENNRISFKDKTTTMSTKDGEYYITTTGSDGEEHTYEVLYTIGSAWKQRYLTKFDNGEFHILPVQWNIREQKWQDYKGLEKYGYDDPKNYWSSKGRIWQYKCAGCHTTGFQINYDEATDTYASTWIDNGVGCEACHGPGSNHILADTAYKTDTIVNPAKIPQTDIGVMICGSCHSDGSSAVDKRYGYPVGYKPGMNLIPLYDPVTPEKDTPKHFWPSGDSRKHGQQYLDWKTSEHARAGIACWDCHTLHSQGEGKFQTKLAGTSLCKACHGEPRRVPGLAGLTHTIMDFGNCVRCHMPLTAKSMNPGDISSHRFKVIKPEASIKLLLDKAAQKDETVLGFYGLEAKDVEGLNKTEVEELLKNKALEAMHAGKSMEDLLWNVQPNSCNACHNHVSPWILQEYLEPPRLHD
ncbi:MAG: multiheme c-type cytochrome [Candidatus Hydrothermarchaeales archaeon]